MKSTLARVWRWVRWPLGVVLVLYIALVIYRIPAVGEKERTQKAVERIHAQRITLADVMGNNLPPTPNEEQNNATVEGVDANNNGIRDDVELAIFAKYPNSARVRAAELQYAMALQMELTEVFNSDTLVATIQEASRGNFCIADTVPNAAASSTPAQLKNIFNLIDTRSKEVENFVLNTTIRQNKREENFKHAVSHGDVGGSNCDISLAFLSG